MVYSLWRKQVAEDAHELVLSLTSDFLTQLKNVQFINCTPTRKAKFLRNKANAPKKTQNMKMKFTNGARGLSTHQKSWPNV